MSESVALCGRHRNLVGILTRPETAPAEGPGSAVVFLNSGLLHRAAPHRLYVQLARRLAAEGTASFRFDFAGYGDSPESPDRESKSPERQAVENTLDVLDHLERSMGIRRFALAGICSGAYVAFKVACSDPRVTAAAPINIPIESFTGNRQLIDELRKRCDAGKLGGGILLDTARWQRLMTGHIRPKRIVEVLSGRFIRPGGPPGPDRTEVDADRQSCLDTLRRFGEQGKQANLVFSPGEPGYDFLVDVVGLDHLHQVSPTVEVRRLDNVDHLLSPPGASNRFIEEICQWFGQRLATEA